MVDDGIVAVEQIVRDAMPLLAVWDTVKNRAGADVVADWVERSELRSGLRMTAVTGLANALVDLERGEAAVRLYTVVGARVADRPRLTALFGSYFELQIFGTLAELGWGETVVPLIADWLEGAEAKGASSDDLVNGAAVGVTAALECGDVESELWFLDRFVVHRTDGGHGVGAAHELMIRRADLLAATGRRDEALAGYEVALGLGEAHIREVRWEDQIRARQGAANQLLWFGRNVEASDSYSRVLSMSREMSIIGDAVLVRALCGRGSARINLDDLDGASSDAEWIQAILVASTEPTVQTSATAALAGLALEFRSKGEFARAVAVLDVLIGWFGSASPAEMRASLIIAQAARLAIAEESEAMSGSRLESPNDPVCDAADILETIEELVGPDGDKAEDRARDLLATLFASIDSATPTETKSKIILDRLARLANTTDDEPTAL